MDKARENIFPILALSYNELHPAMKGCFAYCAIFPKDSNIFVDDLVRIWMAQGFLYSSGSPGDMEQKGREYFEDLAMRSFFQDFGRDMLVVDRIISCKMHDLVHDFAQFLTNNECLIAENIEALVKNGRHLYLLNFEARTTMDIFSRGEIEKLCSFICGEGEIPQNLFNHLKRVKLLNLSGCKLKDIPAEIGNLIHLRFLDLSVNGLLEKLSKSICDLYNLQTLDIRFCHKISGLPHGIHKLVNLRHLFVYATSEWFEFTQGLEKLVNLRGLDYFCRGRGCSNKLGYLKDLNLIGGSLVIHIDDMDDGRDNVVDAEKANLKNKAFIEDLTLVCREEVGSRVIHALQPSPNLRALYFSGTYLPNWITTLINLRKLTIQGGGNEMDVLNSLRNLPFLEHLDLCSLGIERLSVGFFGLISTAATTTTTAFPNLLSFCLRWCKWLIEWEDIGEENENIVSILPRLQHLEIQGCWELKALPHRLLRKAALSLQKLSIIDCDFLGARYDKEAGEGRDEISHIPIVNIS